jgi:tRNA A-37 threonylcarbamoyl transferase component Bud32
MKPKANVLRSSSRAKPLDESQKKALANYYSKVSREAVKRTVEDIEKRQRRAAAARRIVLK